MEAAREAALLGAEVTVLEKSPFPELPWRDWPSLLSRTHSEDPHPSDGPPKEGSVDVELGTEVDSVFEGRAATASGALVRADAFVAATGSLPSPPRIPGMRKNGVWILDSATKYSSLGKNLDMISSAVVAGGGTRALQVSERIRNRGCAVTLCLPRSDARVPSAPLLGVLTCSATASGIRVERGVPERAVGAGALEGVILHGGVVACDALALLPPRSPAPVRTGAQTGSKGGLLVDRWLKTSVPGLYAAGGCAEADGTCGVGQSFADSPAASGRVAGANAAGSPVAVFPTGFQSVSVFGLTWWKAGVGPERHRSMRTEAFSRRWGADSACSITYDTANGAVLGLEAVGPEGAGIRLGPVVSLRRATLRTLAYGEQASTDISVVSDTARLALAHWQRS